MPWGAGVSGGPPEDRRHVRPESIERRFDLALAAGHETLQRLVDRGVELRLLIAGQELLPAVAGPDEGVLRPFLRPGLEGLRIGQVREVELGLEVPARVLFPEKMPARP